LSLPASAALSRRTQLRMNVKLRFEV
jgi:hypothetical protein